MGGPANAVVRFGQFELDLLRRELRFLNGAPVSLTSKALDVLGVLVSRHGETVDRDSLVQAAWPGRVVEDNNLTQAITALRRVFGTQAGDHEYIVTVPGRGYRFVMPLWSSRSGARFALAVLPFDVARGPALEASLGRALAEALLVALGPRVRMPVRSLSAVDALPPGLDAVIAGRSVAATHVVEGSVRHHDCALRVSLRLIDTSNGITLWSRVVDTTQTGIWHLHNGVAPKIAAALRRASLVATERRGHTSDKMCT